MPHTPVGLQLLAAAREAGCKMYDVATGDAITSKVARLRLPAGAPIVIQVNNKTPRVWVLPEHYGAQFAALGSREDYEAGRGRHHHLDQVREFRGQPLVKITVSATYWPTIRAVFAIARNDPRSPA